MRRVRLNRFFELAEDIRRKRSRITDEHETPTPRDEPERNFQAARPVDAHARRVQAKPCQQVSNQRLRVALIAGQSPGLAEVHEPLVAVELPGHFAVADRVAVQRIQPTPVDEWRSPA